MEGDLNPAYISAFAALAGATIGGLTSFATSWLTQRAQLLSAQREAEKAKLEALYTDFIAEAARLLGVPVRRCEQSRGGRMGRPRKWEESVGNSGKITLESLRKL